MCPTGPKQNLGREVLELLLRGPAPITSVVAELIPQQPLAGRLGPATLWYLAVFRPNFGIPKQAPGASRSAGLFLQSWLHFTLALETSPRTLSWSLPPPRRGVNRVLILGSYIRGCSTSRGMSGPGARKSTYQTKPGSGPARSSTSLDRPLSSPNPNFVQSFQQHLEVSRFVALVCVTRSSSVPRKPPGGARRALGDPGLGPKSKIHDDE